MIDRSTAKVSQTRLGVGDPAPWFRLPSAAGSEFALDAAAGRFIVLGFYGSAGDAVSAAALIEMAALRDLFDGRDMAFFAVSNDSDDAKLGRVTDLGPGFRHFWDFDGAVSRRYGLLTSLSEDGQERLMRTWLVLDPMLRIIAAAPFAEDGGERPRLIRFLRGLPKMERYDPGPQAPILFLANVFERTLCDRLIDLFGGSEANESGFHADIDGTTRSLTDPQVKRRRDVILRDPALLAETHALIQRRVVPEIAKAFQASLPGLERPLIACYDGAVGGHFQAHRDNTSNATAHRRFAISLNLNDDFDGGDLTFPEFGRRAYRPPAGGAVIFSCGLLHAVVPVRRGMRYAFLPFLHEDAGDGWRDGGAAVIAKPAVVGHGLY